MIYVHECYRCDRDVETIVADPNYEDVVCDVCRSEDNKIDKVLDQYNKGLMTLDELEGCMITIRLTEALK